MGYTTDFEGTLHCNEPLSPAHKDYLEQFAHTRRMRRSPKIAATLNDPKRLAVGLPVGVDGCFYVGESEDFGQSQDASVRDYNSPPEGQPGLWCQWVPTEDGMGVEWDGGEKFYNYVEWLEYLIAHFYKKWGYVLNGRITWRGESHGDLGAITVTDNAVESHAVELA